MAGKHPQQQNKLAQSQLCDVAILVLLLWLRSVFTFVDAFCTRIQSKQRIHETVDGRSFRKREISRLGNCKMDVFVFSTSPCFPSLLPCSIFTQCHLHDKAPQCSAKNYILLCRSFLDCHLQAKCVLHTSMLCMGLSGCSAGYVAQALLGTYRAVLDQSR